MLFEPTEYILESVCLSKSGFRCVFPFREKENGDLHYNCISGVGKTWCALVVDSNQVYKGDKKVGWDTCGKAKRCKGNDKFQSAK